MGDIENSMETKHNMDAIAENNENTIDSMDTIIKIEDLTYTYPGAAQPTLNHVHLEIEKGDFLAIVGNNGCGKSTLCKVLNGLIPHFISGTFSGNVWVEGENTKNADVGTLARKVGYVYQDFENQIVRPTVLDDASYACLNYGMKDYEQRGREALHQCGLEGREDEYIWQLSGGQTHLLALAGAVALGPEVLILDEPIAQLDPGHADRIYEVLRELNETYGKTIIVIEHHTEYIADYCKHVLLLRDGQAAWMLPAREALARVEELAGEQYLSAAGDHRRLPAAKGRQTAAGTDASDHRGRRKRSHGGAFLCRKKKPEGRKCAADRGAGTIGENRGAV